MKNKNDIISKWNAEMYDREETETYDVEFALSLIGNSPKRVLEIACGSGRFLVPFAKAGHDITGLDLDEHMLDRISAKADGLPNIHWKRSDVINDEWEKDFNVVLIAANFLTNIDSDTDYEKAQELLIRKSYDSLVKGGYVFVDYGYTYHPEYWFGDPRPNLIWEGTDSEGNYGKMILLDSTYDEKTGMASYIRRIEMTFADGEKCIQDTPERKHFVEVAQVRNWLENAGFEILNEWGDYCKKPISNQTSRAILWAKKT